ncbi:MAG: SDR family oxidoreductase [Treponemataceae bacterium]
MDLGLKGKVALVTAASKGLGKASAMALAKEGARVAICSRGESIELAAVEIRDAIHASGGTANILALRGDISVQADIDRIVSETIAHFGRIDILVLNAGGPPPGNFLDFTPDDWTATVNQTLMSAVRLLYAVIPGMRKRKEGSIVAIESVSVKQPIDKLILSNSVRLAVIGLIKSLANEFGKDGIRVNSINPTYTKTDRVTNILRSRAEANGTRIEDETASMINAVPLGRMGTPEEFGATVAWLASPAASYIHGHALMFDGGAVKAAL